MEIILLILTTVFIIAGIIEVVNKKLKLRAYIITSLIMIALTLILYFISGLFSENQKTIRENVLEYDDIVYSVPQVIEETRASYPFWSARRDFSYANITKQ